jgi:Secretion system C-terminal sorting domain
MTRLIAVIVAVLLWSGSMFAQTYLDVAPGVGTLNTAITAHGGTVIYRLQAGGWYILSGQIENNGFKLQIVGTTPGAGVMPAAIQTATKPDGTVLTDMFNVVGDLTIKNVFIVNADGANTIGAGVFSVSSATTVKMVMDSVTVDPIGSNHMIVFNPTPYPKLFITNSLFMRHGNLNGANDWCLFDLAGAAKNGYDTLYLENNTFISTGTHLSINRSAPTDSNNFVWLNHNTFAFHKFQLLTGAHMYGGYFVTNNLFFDFTVQPYLLAWNAYSIDGMGCKYQANVYQDTVATDIVNGVVASTRKLFVEYNNEYLDPRITDYLKVWQFSHTKNNDGTTRLDTAYLMQLAYPKDSAKVNREAGMYNSTGFPKFKFGNYFKTDPQWSNNKFYKIQDSIVNWTLPAMMLNAWGFSAANVPVQPSAAGNWWWCDDPTNNLGNPIAWPRINAAYTNAAMLTASIEGLPLGDLNWFPTSKAKWLTKQSQIKDWIIAENETKFVITDVKQDGNGIPEVFALLQNYPNPFNPSTEIQYSIPSSGLVTLKVYTVLGQEVATLVSKVQNAGNYIVTFDASKLSSGMYMYQVQSGSNTATRKMMLVK